MRLHSGYEFETIFIKLKIILLLLAIENVTVYDCHEWTQKAFIE